MIRNRIMLTLVPAFMANFMTTEAAAIPQARPIKMDQVAFYEAEETALKNLFEQGFYSDVLAMASMKWHKDGDMPTTTLRLVAESLVRTGQGERALSAFQTLVSRMPDDKEAQAGLAYTLVYCGKAKEGLALYERLLRSNYEPIAIAEDGGALLAQGNTYGKALLEKVIAYYPSRSDIRLKYQQIIAWYGTNQEDILLQQAQAKPSLSSGPSYQELRENRQEQKDKAIRLAREGLYDAALNILAALYEADKTDFAVAFDYLTVLHWSGDNDKATAVYENIPTGTDIPVYVRFNAGAAYYRLGEYDKALAAIKPAVDSGDRKARLFEAEIYLRRGEILESQQRYEALIEEDPRDISVYLSRAYVAVAISDYRQGAVDLERVIRLVPDGADKDERLRRYHDDLAAAYINMGRSDKAVTILKPYIDSSTANSSMAGNYILALKDTAQYRQAVEAAHKLWPDYSKGLIFGLRSLAECHIQLKNTAEAVKIYRHIVSREPANDSHKLTLAFGLLLDGRIMDGLTEYEELIRKDNRYVEIAMRDAKSFLATERYLPGKSLFELIIRLIPDKPVYRQEYADSLMKKYHYRAALSQYEALSKMKDGELAGLTGIVRTAIVLEDYKQAREAMEQITYKYGRSKTVAALAQYDSRRQGSADAWYSVHKSYKGQQTKEFRVTAEQNVLDNYWLMVDYKRTRLDDFTINGYATITEGLLGSRYRDGKVGLIVWPRNYTLQYDADDQRRFTLQYDHSYVMDVEAIANVGGPIMTKNYSFTYTWSPNTLETYQVGLSRGLFSDNNQSKGFSINHTMTMYNRNSLNISRNIYWNRTWNKEQDRVYESPEMREGTGMGWTWTRYLPEGNLATRLVLNWERDYPEKITMNPYARMEYSLEMSPERWLTLGAEYGVRAENAWGKGGFRFGYHQYDLLYRMTW